MSQAQVERTLVKSPPELWAELSNPASLARHLGELGEIRITRIVPEHEVQWTADDASGSVLIKPSGWGTRVTLTASRRESGESRAPSAVRTEPPASPEAVASSPVETEPPRSRLLTTAPAPAAHDTGAARPLPEPLEQPPHTAPQKPLVRERVAPVSGGPGQAPAASAPAPTASVPTASSPAPTASSPAPTASAPAPAASSPAPAAKASPVDEPGGRLLGRLLQRVRRARATAREPPLIADSATRAASSAPEEPESATELPTPRGWPTKPPPTPQTTQAPQADAAAEPALPAAPPASRATSSPATTDAPAATSAAASPPPERPTGAAAQPQPQRVDAPSATASPGRPLVPVPAPCAASPTNPLVPPAAPSVAPPAAQTPAQVPEPSPRSSDSGDEDFTAVLRGVLDSLGSAHHRPFSRP
jgi:hypothetical protein